MYIHRYVYIYIYINACILYIYIYIYITHIKSDAIMNIGRFGDDCPAQPN